MNKPDFTLELWTERHRDGFAALHADPVVMADLGGPFARSESDAKFDRYRDAWAGDGISRWAIVDPAGRCLGYAGVIRRNGHDHPLGTHFEIGWRLCRASWGKGYVVNSARRALEHAWRNLDTAEIVSYTAADNLRSRRVMERLGLERDEARDFTADYERGPWSGLVWVARRPAKGAPNPR
jgi:RimJ/RimL family protein N-acetyltransferase